MKTKIKINTMEILKDITKDPKEVAKLLFDYIQSHETSVVEGNAEAGFMESFITPDDNYVKQMCIICIDFAIDACSGLYDELLSVEYGHFDEPDVPRYNWLCKVKKHLENNFEEI